MDDFDLMPFGKYKGKVVSTIPLGYLKWVARQKWCTPDMKRFIVKKLLAQEKEVNEKRAVTYMRKKHGHA